MVDMHTVVQDDDFMMYPLEQLRGKKEEAFIGYLCLNLYDPPKEATWGLYNDRTVNDSWVAHLVQEFTKRLDNCSNADALDVAVRREWIENIDAILPTVNDKKIEDVPAMKFTPDGKEAIQPDKLVMLGGNHRRLALKVYVDEMKEQMEIARAKLKGKGAQAHKQSDITGPIGEELNKLEEKVDWYEKKLESSQHWAVALYDIGEQ
jgi:hypothetical protein